MTPGEEEAFTRRSNQSEQASRGRRVGLVATRAKRAAGGVGGRGSAGAPHKGGGRLRRPGASKQSARRRRTRQLEYEAPIRAPPPVEATRDGAREAGGPDQHGTA